MDGGPESLFYLEQALLGQAKRIADDKLFAGNPLLPHYAELTQNYQKLLRQMERLVRISDMHQVALSDWAEEMSQLSNVDAMTELPNRYCFQQYFENQWNACLRRKAYLAVLMIDIDHFKIYNDSHGHLQGDACLREVGATIKGCLKRPLDLVARYGGEEFVAVLPESGWDAAQHVAQNIVASVRHRAIANHLCPVATVVTVSVGFAVTNPKLNSSCMDLVAEADRALYLAKASGRDRAVSGGSDTV